MLTSKTIYVTSDQKEFNNKEAAEHWEEALQFSEQAKSWETRTGCYANRNLEFLAIVLITHRLVPR